MNIKERILEKSTPLEESFNMDKELFQKEYLKKGRPVVLRGMAKSWDAYKKWDLDYFLSLNKDSAISMMKGEYVQHNSKFNYIKFNDFIHKLKEETSEQDDEKGYIIAMNIFHYFPELSEHTDFSLYTSTTRFNHKLAWIGPKGTITGFHADNPNNLYAQIMGRKLFIFAPQQSKKFMYLSKRYLKGAIASSVDINNFNSELFPLFTNSTFKYVILEPGDILFIPKKWWHYVESLDTSISINTFGYNNREKYTIAFKEEFFDLLHRKGFYKPNNCMCHEIVDGKRISKI